jgi:hypothetical protein
MRGGGVVLVERGGVAHLRGACSCGFIVGAAVEEESYQEKLACVSRHFLASNVHHRRGNDLRSR